jgi:hypothetical protein
MSPHGCIAFAASFAGISTQMEPFGINPNLTQVWPCAAMTGITRIEDRVRPMSKDERKFSKVEGTRRFKTAFGRALVYDLEQGIDWKFDEHGRLMPVAKSFVGEPERKEDKSSQD